MSGDHGLAVQRTALSWTRTALGAVGLAGFLARHAVQTGAAVDVTSAVLAAASAAGLALVAGRRRDRIAAALTAGRSPVPVRSIAAVAALLVATSLSIAIGFLAAPG